MELVLGTLPDRSVDDAPVEMVERKGLGHPDTICDALAEALSVRLCRVYRARFGAIRHHNVDKALLVGGAARPRFGGGEVTAPIALYLAGRAAPGIPIEPLAVDTCRTWLRENLHALDAERHVRVHCLVAAGSQDLVELYDRQRRTGVWLANDTSFGVGYAPLSRLERIVLLAERSLGSARSRAPEIGEDVKVMGVRHGAHIALTVACALVDRHVADVADYLARKERIGEIVRAAAAPVAATEVRVNAADDAAAGSIYLTVTGTSAEAGDDGEVGRGNRVNGLITPYRPMTLEAAAGKNPVTHVGKLYSMAAGFVAAEIVARLPDAADACCRLVSEIGRPVADPALVDILVRWRRRAPETAEDAVRAIVAHQLDGLATLGERIVSGEVVVCP